MIRLRESIDRARRHRWLGPLVLFVLAVLLVLTVLHGAHDSMLEPGSICIAIVVVLLSLVVPVGVSMQTLRVRAAAARAPPLFRRARLTTVSASEYAFFPLRL